MEITKSVAKMSQAKAADKAPSQLISERIAELGDWRGETLASIRALIKQADPEVFRGMEVAWSASLVSQWRTLYW